MTARFCIGVAAGDEKLAATGRKSWQPGPPHRVHREKTEQDKMNQWNQQILAKRDEFLIRHAASEGRAAGLHECRHPRERIRRKPHIGINEHKKRMIREFGEDEAGVLLAAPTDGQQRRRFKPNAMVMPREFADDGGGAVGGMIVEHDDFKVAIVTCERGFERGADV